MYCNSTSFEELKDIFAKKTSQDDIHVCFAIAADDIEYLIDGKRVTTDEYFNWMKEEFRKRIGQEYDGTWWTDVITGEKYKMPTYMSFLLNANMVIFERPWKHNPTLRLFMTACNIYRIPYTVI